MSDNRLYLIASEPLSPAVKAPDWGKDLNHGKLAGCKSPIKVTAEVLQGGVQQYVGKEELTGGIYEPTSKQFTVADDVASKRKYALYLDNGVYNMKAIMEDSSANTVVKAALFKLRKDECPCGVDVSIGFVNVPIDFPRNSPFEWPFTYTDTKTGAQFATGVTMRGIIVGPDKDHLLFTGVQYFSSQFYSRTKFLTDKPPASVLLTVPLRRTFDHMSNKQIQKVEDDIMDQFAISNDNWEHDDR